MSNNPPGTTHRASVEIVGETADGEIKNCMDKIRAAIEECKKALSKKNKVELKQEKVADPTKPWPAP